MAYTKNEKGDAPKMRRGGRRRKTGASSLQTFAS